MNHADRGSKGVNGLDMYASTPWNLSEEGYKTSRSSMQTSISHQKSYGFIRYCTARKNLPNYNYKYNYICIWFLGCFQRLVNTNLLHPTVEIEVKTSPQGSRSSHARTIESMETPTTLSINNNIFHCSSETKQALFFVVC